MEFSGTNLSDEPYFLMYKGDTEYDNLYHFVLAGLPVKKNLERIQLIKKSSQDSYLEASIQV